MMFYTHVEHSPTKTIYVKYYLKKQQQKTRTHTHTHTRTPTQWLQQKLGTDIS